MSDHPLYVMWRDRHEAERTADYRRRLAEARYVEMIQSLSPGTTIEINTAITHP